MACGCNRRKEKFLWTSADGKKTFTYLNQLAADAKVRRVGGSWEKLP